MKNHTLLCVLTIAGLITAFTPGCQTASNEQHEDVVPTDVADSTDSTTHVDSQDGVDASGRDGAAPDTSDTNPLFSDTARWMNERSCEGIVEYPEVNETYSEPSRGEALAEGRQTADEFLGTGLPGGVVIAIIPNESLNPGSERPYDLYSDSGDVEFHLYIYNSQPLDVVRTYRSNITILVDYEPVDATITHWNDERDTKLAERVGSGINVPADSQVDIFDMTIPASHFTEDRMYEIGVSLEMNSHPYRTVGLSSRFVVYRNGYNRPSRPCSIPSLNEEIRGKEFRLLAQVGTNNALLFSDDIKNYSDVDVVHNVEPGEIRRFYTSFRSSQSQSEAQLYFVPTLDGEPIQDGWYVETPLREPTPRTYIDARRSFEVTFPTEPGIYEVQLASWVDPFVMAKTIDGEDIDRVQTTTNSANSNALRFRVEEPE